jgi:hypothetical protein
MTRIRDSDPASESGTLRVVGHDPREPSLQAASPRPVHLRSVETILSGEGGSPVAVGTLAREGTARRDSQKCPSLHVASGIHDLQLFDPALQGKTRTYSNERVVANSEVAIVADGRRSWYGESFPHRECCDRRPCERGACGRLPSRSAEFEVPWNGSMRETAWSRFETPASGEMAGPLLQIAKRE